LKLQMNSFILSVLSVNNYFTICCSAINYAYVSDEAILDALRGWSHLSVPPPASLSRTLAADNVGSTDGRFPRKEWWAPMAPLSRKVHKRQDVSSYNLNSFGLRYGK
uniref:Kisspeptin 1 n=1 Tax=Sphaeramia orbicularis TaxID=375764 RepID=A0A673ABB7_9TELE